MTKAHVLLVDDEELVREVTAMTLEDSNFIVSAASNGKDALELYAKNSGITAAIVDFSMPEMTGYELMKRLRELNPTLGLVMISGLNMTPEVQTMQKSGGLEFLSKPFENNGLLRALGKVMKWSQEQALIR